MTRAGYIAFKQVKISTHTPLAGRDKGLQPDRNNQYYFYSHAPCGTWHWLCLICPPDIDFYSHAPCGTWHLMLNFIWVFISFLLTRPLRDVTFSFSAPESVLSDFYSHAPCGTWRHIWIWIDCIHGISTHTPLAGRDMTRFAIVVLTY